MSSLLHVHHETNSCPEIHISFVMMFYLNTEGQETMDTTIQNRPCPFKVVSVISCLFVLFLVTVLVKVTNTCLLPLLEITIAQ